VDVMALRGDSIDNIPGAPGIGDKGSVEIIRRFGTLENALDQASEVEKRTYRESLLNNRDTILLSKQLVTIDSDVPVELDLNTMVAREQDTDALRALFNELEFTTLLAEVSPQMTVGEAKYRPAGSASDVEAELKLAKKSRQLAVAVEFAAAAGIGTEEEAELENETDSLPLIPPSLAAGTVVSPGTIAISGAPASALSIKLD